MFCPERSFDYAWSDGCDAHTEPGVERCEGAHEAVESVFGGIVDRGGEGGELAGYGRYVNDVFGGWSFWGGGRGGEEMGESELSGADWVREIDVEVGVVV